MIMIFITECKQVRMSNFTEYAYEHPRLVYILSVLFKALESAEPVFAKLFFDDIIALYDLNLICGATVVS